VSFSFLRLACLVASAGCGGATYELGNVGDGGEGGAKGASQGSGDEFCFGDDAGCEGGSGFSSADGASGFSFGEAGNGNTTSGPEGGTSSGGSNGECTVTSLAACPAGTTGYVCTNDGPGEGQPTVSCSSGDIEGYDEDYCCFPWPAGSACAPYPDFPCDAYSFGYQCSPGTFPPSVESKLSCGDAFPDSNGDNDFCCTYQ
jgi:hypothetical protein